MEAVKIENIKKYFKQKKKIIQAVDDVSFSIHENELFGLLGVNGAGKSTLIQLISGLIQPTSGNVICFEMDSYLKMKEVKQIINVSPQETAIAEKLSVYENLIFMAELYGIGKEEAIKKANEMIDEFSLEDVKNQKAKTLSGGYQRRLSIAMALITSPRILILDEPTLGLDVIARRELWDIIEKLRSKMTIILTTHYLEEGENLCDRIAILVKGKLKALGSIEELKRLGNSNQFEDAFVHIATGKGE